jgi:tetratricopeptide (TPR) repeat protein
MIDSRLLDALTHRDAATRGQAIRRLAKLADPKALPYLAEVHINDPDPDLRELARRAAIFIRKQSPAAASAVRAAEPEVRISEADERRARDLLSRALDEQVAGQPTRALRLLREAITLDPRLKDDAYARNLAGEVTGQPGPEALAALMAEPARRTISRKHRPFALLMLIAALLTLGGFALPWMTLGDDEYTGLDVASNRDGAAWALTETIDPDAEIVRLGRDPLSFSPYLLPAVGVVQIVLGVMILASEPPSGWYWAQGVIAGVIALGGAAWFYLTLENSADLIPVSLATLTGSPPADAPADIATGWLVGVAGAALMPIAAVAGLLFGGD